MSMDWSKGAMTGLSGAATGAAIGSVVPGIGTAIGAAGGGLIGLVSGLFSGGDDGSGGGGGGGGGGGTAGSGMGPNGAGGVGGGDVNSSRRQMIVDKILSSHLGDEYAQHAAAVHQDRAQSTYDQVTRSMGANPAARAAVMSAVQHDTENQNVESNLAGARMDAEGLQQAGSMLSQDRQFDYMANKDAQDRASRPSVLEQSLSSGLTSLIGGAAGGAGKGLGHMLGGLFSGGGDGGGGGGDESESADV